MGLALVILAAVLAVAGVFAWLTYNRMVSRRNAVDNSWAQIDAALQRRHDLIPAWSRRSRATRGTSRRPSRR